MLFDASQHIRLEDVTCEDGSLVWAHEYGDITLTPEHDTRNTYKVTGYTRHTRFTGYWDGMDGMLDVVAMYAAPEAQDSEHIDDAFERAHIVSECYTCAEMYNAITEHFGCEE